MTNTAELKTTKVDPARLAPDFDNLPDEFIAEEHTFWLGVTSNCPCGQIDVAGLHFPRSEERLTKNEADQQVRVPEHGTINATVTKHHFTELMKVLPRLVIRPSKVLHEERGTGENTKDPAQRIKGKLIKIPDAKMLAGALEGGRKLKPYVQQPGDRPATEFMYFIHAPNGQRGHESERLPISEVGLEWPAELQEFEDLMS